MVKAHPPNQRAAKKRNQKKNFNAGGNVGTVEDRGRSSPLHTSSPTVYITKTLMKMRNTTQMSYQTSKRRRECFSNEGLSDDNFTCTLSKPQLSVTRRGHHVTAGESPRETYL